MTSRRAPRRLYPHGFLAIPLDGLPTAEARELMLASLGQTAGQLGADLADELCDLGDGHLLRARAAQDRDAAMLNIGSTNRPVSGVERRTALITRDTRASCATARTAAISTARPRPSSPPADHGGAGEPDQHHHECGPKGEHGVVHAADSALLSSACKLIIGNVLSRRSQLR